MDSIATSHLIITLVILILMSSFFSSAETGMMSLNRYKLKHQAERKDRTAMRVQALLNRPNRLIGLILIGNNLVNILASSIATVVCIRLFGDLGVAIATFGLTIVILIFGEVTPKTLAAMYPERFAFPSSLVLKYLMIPLYPFVLLLNGITSLLLRLLGIKPEQSDDSLSRDELRTIVNQAGAMIPQRHQDMLLGILDLDSMAVEHIMVPRNDIYGININDDWDAIVHTLTSCTHTKILLYKNTIDDVVGLVHARDALHLLTKESFDKNTLLRAAKDIYFIPEGTPLHVQLAKFQANKERTGLVVDEYGDIQGLITLEDILEEIVGDFTTSMAPQPQDEIVEQSDGSFIIEASITVREFNKTFNWQLPTDGPITLNGLILEYLEDIPEPYIEINIENHPLHILDVEDNMIKRVKIYPEHYQGDADG